VLKGTFSGTGVSQIEVMRPAVVGAKAYRCQVWSVDKTNQRVEKCGRSPLEASGKGAESTILSLEDRYFVDPRLLKTYWFSKVKVEARTEDKTTCSHKGSSCRPRWRVCRQIDEYPNEP
jgi:hypothetical protein